MCIEVAADDGTRILLDLGMPLYDANRADYPLRHAAASDRRAARRGRPVRHPGSLRHDPTAPAYAAIIVTHSHLDHYGLAHHAHPAIPVYASRGTMAIFEVSRVFFPDAALPADVRRCPTGRRCASARSRSPAIPVDHSAPDARALLVEADGQRLLYSGDLRAHGRTGFRFEKLLADTRLRGADWLLVEGTTLGAGGGSHGLRSEQDVEEELVALARGEPDKAVVVVASGQNLDRLVSCYRAAKRTGRQLVVDPYQAFVLMKLAPLSQNIPQFTWDDVARELHPPPGREAQGRRHDGARPRDGARRPGRLLRPRRPPRQLPAVRRGAAGARHSCSNRIGAANAELVWSMWGGYWERDDCAVRKWAEREGVEAHFIHSGGHAWPDDLRRLEKVLSAKETLVVHTDNPSTGYRPGAR